MKTIFNPFLFPVAFIGGYALYAIQLVNSINQPELETTAYVVFSMLLYCVGALISSVKRKTNELRKDYVMVIIRGSSGIRRTWYGYFISIIFFLAEYVVFIKKYGAPPMFLPDFEVLRFDFGINGYVHIMAIMCTVFIVIIMLDLMSRWGEYGKTYKLSCFIALVFTAMLVIMMGHRGVLLNIIIPLLIGISLKKYRIKPVILMAIGMALFYLFGLAKLLRDYSFYGETIFQTIESDWIFGGNSILAPLYYSYLGIAMNFNMLNEYIIHVKTHMMGYFTIAKPLLTPFPGFKYGMIEYQREVLGIDFHGTLTSTILAMPYIDFGVFGAFIMSFLGWVNGNLYYRVTKTRSLRFILPYSYLCYQTLLGLYTYAFAELYVIIYVIVYLYFGYVLERPVKYNAAKCHVLPN